MAATNIAVCYEPRTREITGGQTLERLIHSSDNYIKTAEVISDRKFSTFCLFLHSTKLTHPLSQIPHAFPLSRFHTLALARPSPTSQRSSTTMTRVRRRPIRKTPVLASFLLAVSFYGACSESAKEGSKTANLKGLLLTSFWQPDMLFSIYLGLCDESFYTYLPSFFCLVFSYLK